jgi:hypothetical protein
VHQPRADDLDVLPRSGRKSHRAQVDNFPDAAALQAWFQSGDFAKNPIGVEFDPEKLLARWENGDPEAELIRQGSA